MRRTQRTLIALIAVMVLLSSCSVVQEGLQAIGGSEATENYGPPTGEVAIEAKFVRVGNFSGGLAGACVAREFTRSNIEVECGYIDRQGEWEIEPQWEFVYDFSDGLARVQITDGLYAFVTPTGDIAFKLKADEVSDFSQGVAWVADGYDYWLIDSTGKRIGAPLQGVQMIGGFHDGLALAARVTYYTYENNMLKVNEQDGKVGFINRQGRWQITPNWNMAGQFSEGLAMVGTQDENYQVKQLGFINTKGEYVIGPNRKFVDAAQFSSGLVAVKQRQDNLWVFIDRSGKQVIPEKFGALSMYEGWRWRDIEKVGFSAGLVAATVSGDTLGGFTLFDRDGKRAFPVRYSLIGRYQEGLARFAEESELNGLPSQLWGFIS